MMFFRLFSGFNPRSRVGSDYWRSQIYLQTACFNPRSRVGSDHQVPSAVTQRLRFQSTLPRGERLFHIVNLSFCRVSIHAPAWGATYKSFQIIKLNEVSIHAPAWGATALTLFCDLGSLVSIHAPAWGAT